MPPNTSPDLLVDNSSAARTTSSLLMIVAGVALIGNCLLTSPGQFSSKHQSDTSLLKPVVTLLGLNAQWPTTRGIEIRNLCFYLGAAILGVIGGLRLLTSGRQPRLSSDDLLDVRRRAASPYFWWFLLLLVSVVSTTFSLAPHVLQGQTIIRFLHLSWWLPLAALLAPRDARRLAGVLVAALTATGAVGVWYHLSRDSWEARLQYPIGNELWMAACLLPGLFIAGGFTLDAIRSGPSKKTVSAVLGGASILILLVAIGFTRSRSAAVGFAAGVLTFVVYATPRARRVRVLLVSLLIALGGVLLVQSPLVQGKMGQRVHSLRARLNHEWPYAIDLFRQKVVAGNGDGAYALLAGRYARDEQLDDPIAIGFNDEKDWITHAHNEFLELAADLGLLGLISFLAAMILCLYRAAQIRDAGLKPAASGSPAVPSALDATPGGSALSAANEPTVAGGAPVVAEAPSSPTWQPQSPWLVVGLSGALVALAVEECSDTAFRQPGLPPILLTVWALLWVMVRHEYRPTYSATEAERLKPWALRWAGVAACIAGIVLGRWALQDWVAARSRSTADRAVATGQYDVALTAAAYAAEHTLDPFQQLAARLVGASTKAEQFSEAINKPNASPTQGDVTLAGSALQELNSIQHDAPGFVRVSRIQSNLLGSLTSLYARAGNSKEEQGWAIEWVRALIRNREDEPFSARPVALLWRLRPDASAAERLKWLRCLLRGGEMSTDFMRLFSQMDQVADFVPTLVQLYEVAAQDIPLAATSGPMEGSPPGGAVAVAWRDRLSPETFRLVALAKAYGGKFDEAIEQVKRAIRLYETTGNILFRPHSAAVRELAMYEFAKNPAADPGAVQRRLLEADSIIAGKPVNKPPPTGMIAQTWLDVLIGAGREKEARADLEAVGGNDPRPVDERLAMAYMDLAIRMSVFSGMTETTLRWSRRACELAPRDAGPYALVATLLLKANAPEEQILAAVKRYTELASDAAASEAFVADLQRRYPSSEVWARLGRPPITSQPAATTQPITTAPVD